MARTWHVRHDGNGALITWRRTARGVRTASNITPVYGARHKRMEWRRVSGEYRAMGMRRARQTVTDLTRPGR